MKKIKIAVKDNASCLLSPIDLIQGTIGLPCTFYFDNDWKTLPTKKVSFKIDTKIIGTYDLENDTIIVPAHVLNSVGSVLEIGIIGYSNDNQIVIPTSWCHIGIIRPGAGIAIPGDDEDNLIYYDGGVIL